jgi:hypothetical protein
MASTTDSNFQQVGGLGQLSQVPGQARKIIGDAVATRQLQDHESGALCLFDRAAGTVYTLPTPVIGMFFDFYTTVSRTSNAHKVITKKPASEFLLGIINQVIATSATTLASQGDGSTHVAISMNGTTTGGVIGDQFRLTAISSTQWVASGLISGSGSLATPYSTS